MEGSSGVGQVTFERISTVGLPQIQSYSFKFKNLCNYYLFNKKNEK